MLTKRILKKLTPFVQTSRRFASKHMDLNYSRASIVDKLTKSEEEIILQFNLPQNSFQLTCDNQTTLQDINDSITEKTGSSSVLFLNTDKYEISQDTRLNQLGNRDFFLLVNNQALLRVKNSYDNYSEFNDNEIEKDISALGAPYFYTKIVSSYLQRLETLNEQNMELHAFDDAYSNQTVNVDDLIENMIEALADPKINYALEVEPMTVRLKTLKERFQQLSNERDIVKGIAKKRAKWIMSLGLFALIGNFTFVGVGTYYIWSWDVVEPLAYFGQFGASIILATQYFKLRGDYENSTYLEYLTEKQMIRIAPKYGLDLEEYEMVRMEINDLKEKLKMSLLIDL